MSFDGNDYLRFPDETLSKNGTSYTEKTIIIAFRTGADITTGTQFLFGQGDRRDCISIYISGGSLYYGASYNTSLVYESTGAIATNTSYVFRLELDYTSPNTLISGYLNGAPLNTVLMGGIYEGKNTSDGILGASERRMRTHIGETFNAVTNYFTGDIMEFLSFDEILSSTRTVLIDNYLCTKYGLNPANDKYIHDVNHSYELFGIAYDNDKVHLLSQGSGIIKLDNSTVNNNGNYLFIGHDDGDITTLTNTLANSMAKYPDRTWRADEYGEFGSVRISIDTTLLPSVSGDYGSYILMVDTDEDGDFDTGPPDFYGLENKDGIFRYSPAVDLEPGDIFTVALGKNVSAQTGLWSDPASWTFHVPVADENAIILNGHTITLDVNATVDSLIIEAGGEIQLSGNQITIEETIDNSGTFTSQTGTVIYDSPSGQDIPGLTYYDISFTGAGAKTLTGDIIINNDLSITDASTVVNGTGYQISLSGNWLNTGQFTETNSTVILNGGGTSLVNRSDGLPETFWNLTINAGTDISANIDLIVGGTMVMSGGNIDLNGNTVILGVDDVNPGTLTYTTGRVIGTMGRWVRNDQDNIDILFPVGVTGFNRHLTYNFTDVSSSGFIYVGFDAVIPVNNGLPIFEGSATINNMFSEGFWSIIKDGLFGFTGTYDIDLIPSGFSSYPVDGETRILSRFTASDWFFNGTHVAGGASLLERDDLTQFVYEYGIGYAEACVATLVDCPANITTSTGASCDAVVTWTAPTMSNPCPGLSITSTDNSGDTFSVGTTLVRYSLMDGAVEVDFCVFTVTVEDNIFPSILCRADQNRNTDLAGCYYTVVGTEMDPVSATDNCTFTLVNNINGTITLAGEQINTGTTTVTWLITDASLNLTNCSMDIIVTDNVAPVISGCPADQGPLVMDPLACGATVNFVDPTANDNCDGVVAVVRTDVTGLSSGDLFPAGSTTISYRATDAHGNVSTCSFDVTVDADAEAPVISGCPADQGPLVMDAGACGATVNFVDPTANDNCDGVVAVVRTDVTGLSSGDLFPSGSTTISYSATDGAGNISLDCSFDVIVTDNEVPVIIAPANVTVGNSAGVCTASGVALGVPVTSDNCSVAGTTNDAPATFPFGSTSVTWTVTDGAGNLATATQTVTVNDTENPVATCKDITVNLDALGNATITGNDVDNGSTDNCGIATKTAVPNTFTTANIGPNVVTLTVTDVNSNVSTCSSTVTVIGTVPPSAYYSYQPGFWDLAITWTTDPGGTTGPGTTVPGPNDKVVILPGRTVSLRANVSAANLDITINSGGILNQTTFAFTDAAGLTALKGGGIHKLASQNYPVATTNSFVTTDGGTTEYNHSGTMSSTQSTYYNLIIRSGGTVTQVNNLTVNGNVDVKTGKFEINNTANTRRILIIKGDLTVDAGASIGVGTGVTNTITTPTTAPAGEAGGFVNYYETQSHRVQIYGNFTNNGTVKFTNLNYPIYNAFPSTTPGVTTGFATVYFSGSTDNTVTLNGPTTFYNMIVQKGSDQTYKLTLYSSAYNYFRLFGANNAIGETPGANPLLKKALWIRTGTLVLQGLSAIPSLSEGNLASVAGFTTSDYFIPQNGALVLDGGGVIVLSTADDFSEVKAVYGLSSGDNTLCGINLTGGYSGLSILGKLQVNSGYLSTRESSGLIYWSYASGQFILNGGKVDAKQFHNPQGTNVGLVSYVQSGGTMILRGRFINTISYVNPADLMNPVISSTRTANGIDATAGIGTFSISSNTNNAFGISGGTLYIHDVCNAGAIPLAFLVNCPVANINVSGGTVEFKPKTQSAAENHYINSTASFNNLIVNRESGNASVILVTNPIVVNNDLTVTSGVLNANNLDISIGRHFSIASGTAYTPGTNSTIFNGTGAQTLTVNLPSVLNLYKLTVNKPAGTVLTLSGTQPTISVNSDFRLALGILDDNGKTVNIAGNVYNSGIHIGTGKIVLNGTVLQSIDGNGTFRNIDLINTNAAAAPVSLSANMTVKGVLNLANDKLFNIGIHNLKLDSTASVSNYSTTRYIQTSGNSGDGGVTKVYTSSASFLFPVGAPTNVPSLPVKYTPATIGFSSDPTTFGSITVTPVGYEHPAVTTNGQSLTYFWRVKSSGFTGIVANSVTHSFLYDQSDVVGTEGNYIPSLYNRTLFTWNNGLAADINTGSNIISDWTSPANSKDFLDADYTAGDAAFGTPLKFYSIANSAWNLNTTWSHISGGVAVPAGAVEGVNFPGPNSIVIIENNHTVNLTSDRRCASLQIATGSVLDIYTWSGSVFSMVQNTTGGNGLFRLTTTVTTTWKIPKIFTFPAGDFSDFNNNSGTTEFYDIDGTAGALYILPANVTSYGNLMVTAKGGDNLVFPNNALTTIKGDLTCGGDNNLAWICMSWSTPAARGFTVDAYGTCIEKTVHVTGNMFINTGTFIYMDDYAAQHLVVDGNITVNNNAWIDVFTPSGNSPGSGITRANSILAGGNFVNNSNGYVRLLNGAYYCDLTFAGNNNATFSGTSPSTILNKLIINKGSSQATTLNLTIGGTLSTPVNNWLTLQNGTFIYNRTNPNTDFAISNTTAFSIPATSGLTVNLPSNTGNRNILISNTPNNNSDLLLSGKLTLVNGRVFIGGTAGTDVNNNDIEYSSSGAASIDVQGGLLQVNGQIRRNPLNAGAMLKYSQSGGIVTINGQSSNATNAKLEVLNVGSDFTMSAGTLNIVRGNGSTTTPFSPFGDLYLRPETGSVTGGTIIFSQGATAKQNYYLDANIPLNNLTITGNASPDSAIVRLLVSPLVLNGDMTINANSVLNSNNLNITFNGNLVNTPGVAGYKYGTNTTTFSVANGAPYDGAQTITGATDFYDLVVSPGTSLTISNSSIVNRNLTLNSGNFILGVNPVSVKGDFSNNAAYLDNNLVGNGILLNGTALQHISGTGAYARLTLNNALGAQIENDITFQEDLTLTTGIFDIKKYLLTLGTGSLIQGAPFSATKMITSDGVFSNVGLKKFFNTGGTTFLYPIGTSGKYTPVQLTSTASSSVGSIRINNINIVHPSVKDPANVLDYYWEVQSSGITGFTGNLVFNYYQEDVIGDETNYQAARIEVPGTTWTFSNTVNKVNNQITENYIGSNNLSAEYTAGITSAFFDDVPEFTSNADGDWNDNTKWDWTGGDIVTLPAGRGPNGYIVTINHVVTLDDNYCEGYRTEINGTLMVVTPFFGHNLGTVTGSGKLYLESGSFPAGVFTSFLACSNNATIEYGGSGIYTIIADLYDNISNVIFSGTGTRGLPNKDLTICNLLKIDGPTLDNSTFNKKLTIQGRINLVSGSFNSGSGAGATVTFAGSGLQSVGDAVEDFFIDANAFNNLEINNSSVLRIGDDGAIEVKGNLLLTNGLINTSPTRKLTIVNPSINCVIPSGGSASSFVDGPLIKRISHYDNFLFPIGKAGTPNMLGNNINISGTQAGPQLWSAEYFTPNNESGAAFLTTPLMGVSAQEFYTVTTTDGSLATLNLNWTSNSDVTPIITGGISNIRLAHFDIGTGKWVEVPTSSSGGDSFGTATSTINVTTSATGSDNYTLGSITDLKPRAKLSPTGPTCGAAGIPVSFTAPYTINLNYRLSYKIGVTAQTPIDISVIPVGGYILPTPVPGDYKLTDFTYDLPGSPKTGVVDAGTVTVNPVPDASVAGPDQAICGITTANLAANTPVVGDGLWTIVAGSGGNVITPLSPTSQFIGLNGVIYTLRWTISSGSGISACTSVDDVIINFTLPPAAPAASANQSLCGPSTIANLIATPPAGCSVDWYNLSTGGVLFGSGDPLSNGTTYYGESKVTVGGCVSASRTAVTVTVNALPTAPTADVNTFTYDGTVKTATATVGAGETVDWYAVASEGSTIAAPSGTNVGTYTAYAEAKNTSTGCVSSSRTLVTLDITAAALIITADDKSKDYGAVLPVLTASYSGFVGGDDATDLDIPVILSTTATATSPAGTYPITAVGAVDANYTITHVNGTLDITPASLTITAVDKSKVYGAALPALTASYVGFITGEDETFLDTPVSLSTTATAASPVGTYTITASGAADANYTITHVNGTLDITPASLTITAVDKSKVYGTTFNFVGNEFTVSGLIGSDAVSSVTLTSAGSPNTATISGSPYPIIPSVAVGSGLSNYIINYVNGSFTVTPKTLTITANSQSKVYGSVFNFVGTEFTSSGLVNSDIVLSVTLTSTGSPASALVSGSPYSIIPSAATGSGLDNYNIVYVDGSLVVTLKTLVITANNQAKPYGSTFTFTGTEFSASGLVLSDNVTSVTLTSTGAVSTANVAGSPYPIIPSVAVGTGLDNYAIAYANGALTVNKAVLTIDANDVNKIYGTVLTGGTGSTAFTPTGLQNSETVGSVTITYGAGSAASALVGTYVGQVTASAATGGTFDPSNYAISYNPGDIIVTTATLTITANSISKTYGTPVTFAGTEFTTSGLIGSDVVSSVTLTSSGASANAAVSGSPYSIVASAAIGTGLSNYTISYIDGLLTVNQASLTITATNQIKNYGTVFTFAGTEFTTSGLVAGDGVTSVTLTSTGALVSANVTGSPYPIVPSAAVGTGLNNYNISYLNGSLSVTPASLTITADDQSKVYGNTFTFAGTEFTSSGLIGSDAITSVTLSSTGAVSTAQVLGSPYPVVPSGAVGSGLANYNIFYVNGLLSVTPASLTVTANNQNKTYGTITSFVGTEFTTLGLVGGDVVSNVTLTSTGSPASATVAGSPYPIIVSGATGVGLTNYTISYVNGLLTISSANLTITADDQTKCFGTTFTFAGTEFTASGLIGSDAVSSVTLNSTGAASGATVAGSPYPIIPSSAVGTGLSNYTINYLNGNLTVDDSPVVSVTIAEDANPVCDGTTVNFTATPVNGGTTPSYQWQVNGSNAGTGSPSYSYVPVDGDLVTVILTSSETCQSGGPATSNTVTMTVSPILPVSVSIAADINPICAGATVTFMATPTNGGTTLAYQWYNGATAVGTDNPVYSYIPVDGDIITVVLTSSETCQSDGPATSNAVNMIVNPILPVSVSIAADANPVCDGTTVIFTATPVNEGTTPSYQWYNGAIAVGADNPVYADVPADGDNITVVLTSSETCQSGGPAISNIVSMVVNPTPTVIITDPAAVCSPSTVDLTAVAVTAGSTAGLTFTYWTDATATLPYATETAATEGTYFIKGTDGTGCYDIQPVTVTVNPLPTASVSGDATICNGASTNISITLTGTGPWDFTYSDGTTPVNIVGQVTSPFTVSVSPAVTTTYSVTAVSDANCTGTDFGTIATVTVNALPTASVGGTTTINSGESTNISITLTGTAPWDFTYTDGTTPENIINQVISPYTVSVSPLVTTTYSVTAVTDANCTGTDFGTTATVTVITFPENPGPVTASDDTVCAGQTGVTYAIDSVNMATSYSWTVPVGASIVGTADDTLISVDYSLSAVSGDVTVVGVNATGSSAIPGTFAVVVNPAPVATLASSDPNDTICNGETVTFTAGGGDVYEFFIDGISVQGPGAINTYITNSLNDGETITVEVLDAITGCRAVSSGINISVPPALTITPTSDIALLCFGDSNASGTFTASGGTAPYLFTVDVNTAGASMGTATATDLSFTFGGAGEVKVDVVDNNGCTSTSTITVTEPANLVISSTKTNITCYGEGDGTIDLSVTGGTTNYSYAWSHGPTTEDVNNLTEDTYTVIVTDANGCTINSAIAISEPPALVINHVNTDVTCNNTNDGEINITASGGAGPYTYSWSNGSTSEDLSQLTAGDYTITVTDANNCTLDSTFTIYEPAAWDVSVLVTDVTCYGENNGRVAISVSGGIQPYNYLWSDGQTGQIIDSLSPTDYSVTITDAAGCSWVEIMTIFEPLPILSEIETTNASCPGVPDGDIVLNISGGTAPYTVLWSNSATTKDLTNITDGTYTVEITDANLCTKIDSTIIDIFGENCVTEIPTIITPNGDGKNDVWRIENIQLYSNATIEVYTRWGKLVYRSDDGNKDPWDGTFKGQELPMDSYHYIIDFGDGSKPIVGSVTIVR